MNISYEYYRIFYYVATPAVIDKSLTAHPIMHFRNKTLTLEEISSLPLICLGEGTMTYQFYEDFYRKNGISMNPELETATNDQILPMVENNPGIGYIPDIYARDALKKRQYINFI